MLWLNIPNEEIFRNQKKKEMLVNSIFVFFSVDSCLSILKIWTNIYSLSVNIKLV